MSNRFFIPSFLKKFDIWLLKHKPAAWSARTHLVLYYSVIFSVAITLLCLAVMHDARERSQADVWAGFIGLAAFTGFVVWLIYLLRFNVFKRFGNWHLWEGLKMFALYFISIAILVCAAFIPFIVECVTANNAYNDHELVDDINELNLSVCQLEYKMLPKEFSIDTAALIKVDATKVERYDDQGNVVYVDSADADEPIINYRQHYKAFVDTGGFYSRIRTADSLQKITDSLYVTYDCPDYNFVKSYYAVENSQAAVLSSFEIYNRVIKNYKQPNKAALLKRMDELDKKYALHHFAISNYTDKTYTAIIEERYYLKEIMNSIDNIARKKYWWQDDGPIVVRIFFYVSFIIALLLFIFRSCTVKTFFLSLLAAVILLIATAICIGIFDLYDNGVLTFILLYYMLFFIIAGFIKIASVRSAVQGIALNFTVALTSFIPLVAANLYFELLEDYNRVNGIVDDTLYQTQSQYSFYAETGGILIFLILLEPVFRKLYKRWYSLPEE
jgi:hypothetical protein